MQYKTRNIDRNKKQIHVTQERLVPDFSFCIHLLLCIFPLSLKKTCEKIQVPYPHCSCTLFFLPLFFFYSSRSSLSTIILSYLKQPAFLGHVVLIPSKTYPAPTCAVPVHNASLMARINKKNISRQMYMRLYKKFLPRTFISEVHRGARKSVSVEHYEESLSSTFFQLMEFLLV